MGSIGRRIQDLEEQFNAEPYRKPSQAFTDLKTILNELSYLKQSCADRWIGEVNQTRETGENIPRRVLGPGYTHGELLGLAVTRTVEAGTVSPGRAHAYLDYLRWLRELAGKDPDAVVEWEEQVGA